MKKTQQFLNDCWFKSFWFLQIYLSTRFFACFCFYYKQTLAEILQKTKQKRAEQKVSLQSKGLLKTNFFCYFLKRIDDVYFYDDIWRLCHRKVMHSLFVCTWGWKSKLLTNTWNRHFNNIHRNWRKTTEEKIDTKENLRRT